MNRLFLLCSLLFVIVLVGVEPEKSFVVAAVIVEILVSFLLVWLWLCGIVLGIFLVVIALLALGELLDRLVR